MKSQLFSKFSLLLVCLTISTSFVFSQKKDGTVKIVDYEERVEQAKQNLDKTMELDTRADSIVASGKEMITEAKTEIKELETEKKTLTKQYENEYDALEKQLDKTDKESFRQTKSEMAELTKKYRADLHEIGNKLRIAERKQNKGYSIVKKGEDEKDRAKPKIKEAKEGVKKAESLLKKANKNK